jgi:hypothetical protein
MYIRPIQICSFPKRTPVQCLSNRVVWSWHPREVCDCRVLRTLHEYDVSKSRSVSFPGTSDWNELFSTDPTEGVSPYIFTWGSKHISLRNVVLSSWTVGNPKCNQDSGLECLKFRRHVMCLLLVQTIGCGLYPSVTSIVACWRLTINSACAEAMFQSLRQNWWEPRWNGRRDEACVSILRVWSPCSNISTVRSAVSSTWYRIAMMLLPGAPTRFFCWEGVAGNSL